MCFRIFAKNACENIFVVFAFCLKTLQGIPTENIASAICLKHVRVLFYKEETIPKCLLFTLLICLPIEVQLDAIINFKEEIIHLINVPIYKYSLRILYLYKCVCIYAFYLRSI